MGKISSEGVWELDDPRVDNDAVVKGEICWRSCRTCPGAMIFLGDFNVIRCCRNVHLCPLTAFIAILSNPIYTLSLCSPRRFSYSKTDDSPPRPSVFFGSSTRTKLHYCISAWCVFLSFFSISLCYIVLRLIGWMHTIGKRASNWRRGGLGKG